MVWELGDIIPTGSRFPSTPLVLTAQTVPFSQAQEQWYWGEWSSEGYWPAQATILSTFLISEACRWSPASSTSLSMQGMSFQGQSGSHLPPPPRCPFSFRCTLICMAHTTLHDLVTAFLWLRPWAWHQTKLDSDPLCLSRGTSVSRQLSQETASTYVFSNLFSVILYLQCN